MTMPDIVALPSVVDGQAAIAQLGHNGGPPLEDDTDAGRQDTAPAEDERRALLADLEAAAAHERPETTDIARRHRSTASLVNDLELMTRRGQAIAEQTAVARFPHRARNCCFKIGGSKETAALRAAYDEECAIEDAKRAPMVRKLRRQISGRLSNAAATLRKTLRTGKPAPAPVAAKPQAPAGMAGHLAHSIYQHEMGFPAPPSFRRTPEGEPMVPDVIKPGMLIATTYGTGGIVERVAGPWLYRAPDGAEYPHWTIVYRERAGRRQQGWINECVAEGGQIGKLFGNNPDRIVVVQLEFAPGDAAEAQRRTSAGVVWEPCKIVAADSLSYRVRFNDGAELPRPPGAVRSL